MARGTRYHVVSKIAHGGMSPLVILFHTAFQWGNQLATSTYVSVVVVVVTGLIGRYFYGWVRVDPLDAAQAGQLGQQLAEMAGHIPPEWRQYADARDPPLRHIFSILADGPTFPRSLPGLFLGMPAEALRVARGLSRCRRLFLDGRAYRGFRAQVQELRRLRARLHFHRRFKRLMSMWRSLHVVLAIVLLALIGMHVWVSIRVGFRWLWS